MCALRHSLPVPTLSPDEARFLRNVADDTEDAPWMVMNDRQFWNASGLAWSLETYARTHGQSWHVGSMLPLTYLPPGARRRKQVAPDVFAAIIDIHGRDSLTVDKDGMPPFVLEAVSSSSVGRDLVEKTELYRLLGAWEYAIVRLDLDEPRLEGYRRAAHGAWEAWEPDSEGRLWSNVLALGLAVRGNEMRAMTREGILLRTLPEETRAREQAEAERRQEAEAREQAESARRQAEAEVARLRAALDRLTQGGAETTDQ